MKNKMAFTLAEVLITLGIIGVVAAMTLPMLIANYQKKVLVEQLKVEISILDQGFKKAMADDGVDDLINTELFANCKNNQIYADNSWRDLCAPLLKKYFVGIKFESVPDMIAQGDNANIITNTETCKKLVGKTNKWWYLNDHTKCRGWKNIAVTFANGMRADMITSNDDANIYYAGSITAADINGSKGPNTWGRDTFYLKILHNGNVVPYLSQQNAIEHARISGNSKDLTTYNWKLNQNYSEKFCTKEWTTDEGSDCAARIIDNGWVMDY